MARIYISSTYSDLHTFRKRVYRMLRQMGHDVIAMEDYVATDKRPLQKCLEDVAHCDLYVGIFAWRYGYIPLDDNPDGKSITELELRKAKKAGIECLLFLHDEKTGWPPSEMDTGDQFERIKALRAELCRGFTIGFFSDRENLAALVGAAVSLWERKNQRESTNSSDQQAKIADHVIESILDILSTKRAFFKGDERVLDEAKFYVGITEHMLKMLGYLDAGRAVVVARSFAEVVAGIQQALSHVGSIQHAQLKEQLVKLIVACKDYAERYGRRPNESYLPLPHIGWKQRLEDFTWAADQFGFASDDSIETYKTLLEYLSQSCGDLMCIRTLAQAVVECIGKSEMAFKNRCDNLCSMISEGTKCLLMIKEKLDQSTHVIQEVIEDTDQFEARRRLLRERASLEDAVVSQLLLAIAGVRSSRAWSIQTPATKLTKVECCEDFRIRVSFADERTGELELGEDFWKEFKEFSGLDFSMEPKRFQSVSLDIEQNRLIWDEDRRITLTGKYVREMLNSRQAT